MQLIRHLLVPFGVRPQAEERLRGALAIARYFAAHLTVLRAGADARRLIPEGVFGIGGTAVRDLLEAADRNNAERMGELKAIFDRVCNEISVPVVSRPTPDGWSVSWCEAEGLRSNLVARWGRLVDAVVVPRPPQPSQASTLQAALLESGRPVFVMPRLATAFDPRTVLVAWDGSLEAARAVNAALEVLGKADRTLIVTTEAHLDALPGAKALVESLAWHGIAAELRIVADGHGPEMGETLLAAAREVGAGLLVSGAFGRHRMHDLLVGSVTRHLVNHAQMPLLMAH